MYEDISEQIHKPLYYMHVLVRDKDGSWVFFDQPVAFTALNSYAAQGVVEVIMRKALAECPWIRIPMPGTTPYRYDMTTVRAPTLEAFALMNLEEIERLHDR